MRKILKWLAGIAFLAVLVSILFPLYVSSLRPPRQTFQITRTYAQTALDGKAMGVNNLTIRSVVVEGPCSGGCYGGILSQQTPTLIKQKLPSLENYNGETTTLIWLYNVKPLSVVRRNDFWGEDELTIKGVLTRDKRNYYAVVPKVFTEPHLEWIFVETNE